MNHLQILLDIKSGKRKRGQTQLNLRRFTVECLSSGEYLVMSVQAIDQMKKSFKEPSRKFFKQQID